MSYDRPPVPLKQLRQQPLKNREYALAVLKGLPDDQAALLLGEFGELTRAMTAAFDAGDAVEHYRLDKQLFFQFLLRLDFAL